MQSLTGLLNFLCRAIHPGRAFTHRMYAKFSGDALQVQMPDRKGEDQFKAKRNDQGLNSRGSMKLLQQHHHVRLDREFKEDCKVWINFLEHTSVGIMRPFIDLNTVLNADILDWYTDSAKGPRLSFGGVFKHRWFFGQWQLGYIEKFNPSIEYLELYAVCVSVFAWADLIKNRRIVLFCDNQSVVSMINQSSSSCKNCMLLIHMLTSRCLFAKLRIFACWVRGAENQRADYLSRQKIQKFIQFSQEQQGQMVDCFPTAIPEELWPLSRLWLK